MAEEDASGPRRVHYFNGQLLDAGDFTAEQDYHVGMRRRLNRFLHGVGVAGDVGLRVRKEGDRRLRIGAGVAIDAQGQEIVLVADRVIDLDAVKAKAGTTVFLTLAYGDVLDIEVLDAGTASAVNHRRTAETPRIDFVAKKPPDGGEVITLASITIDAGGNIAEIDNTVRGFVGSAIDPKSEPTVRNLSVTGNVGVAGSHKVGGRIDAGANVEVGGNLGVAGNAELRGNVAARTLTVAAGADIVSGLKVQGVCELRSSASVGVDLSVAGRLNVVGEARVGRVLMDSAGLAVGALVEQMRIVRGIVLADASQQDQQASGGFAVGNSGPGWRVSKGLDSKTNKGLAGIYDIVFQPRFAGLPSVTLTPIHVPPLFKQATAADFGGTAGNVAPKAAEIIGFDNEKMRVRTFNPQTNANVDTHFSFVVIGPQ